MPIRRKFGSYTPIGGSKGTSATYDMRTGNETLRSGGAQHFFPRDQGNRWYGSPRAGKVYKPLNDPHPYRGSNNFFYDTISGGYAGNPVFKAALQDAMTGQYRKAESSLRGAAGNPDSGLKLEDLPHMIQRLMRYRGL